MDSPTLTSRQVAASSAKVVGRHEWTMIACTVLAALLAWPLTGRGQDGSAIPETGAVISDVEIVQPSAVDRHVELRRALLSDDDMEAGVREPRRLTPEQRIELHRRLRDALRSAYGERTRAEQTAP